MSNHGNRRKQRKLNQHMDKTHLKPKRKQINPERKTQLCQCTDIIKAVYITSVWEL